LIHGEKGNQSVSWYRRSLATWIHYYRPPRSVAFQRSFHTTSFSCIPSIRVRKHLW
jgi:hypothetical protein